MNGENIRKVNIKVYSYHNVIFWLCKLSVYGSMVNVNAD